VVVEKGKGRARKDPGKMVVKDAIGGAGRWW
jgi:hypothetical protein